MRHTNVIVMLATALVVASNSTSHADDETGSLVGSSFVRFGADLGSHSGEAFVDAAEGGTLAGDTELSGFYGAARVTMGGLLRVTRFGTEVGLEGTCAMGYIGGGAITPKSGGIFFFDLSGGVVAALARLEMLGGFALKGFGGIGMDMDMHYLYAGGRLAFGETSDSLGLELGYTYRVGDSYGENVQIADHRFAADVLIRDANLTVGAALWLGSSHGDYTGTGIGRSENMQVDQLYKGDYTTIVVSVAYTWF